VGRQLGRVQSGVTRKSSKPYRLRLGPLAIADWMLMVLVCLVPIIFIVVRSFGRVNSITLDVEMSGTIDAYRTLFSSTYRPVVLRSLTLSALTVLLCLVVGLPAALAMSRLGPRLQTWALVAVMMPSFVSFSVRIFAWQGVLATGGPVESITGLQLLYRPPAVLIGMLTAYVPLFILPTYSALSRVPRETLEAASDLYAPWRRQLTTVTLPLAMPGIVSGAVLVAVLSIGEFIVPAVLGGGKVLLLGNILAERGAGRDQPLGGAITLTMLVLFLIAASAWLLVRRRTAEYDGGGTS
jgi:ABC-type spermidine/putrescine transport system permease subunit I